MDRLLTNAPRWLRVLLPFLFGAVLVALVSWGYWYFTGRFAIGGVIGGLVGGLGGMVLVRRRQRQAHQQVAQLPEERYDEALRAAQKGSAPTDPEIRHAAIQLLTHDLEKLERRRVLLVIFIAGLLAVTVAATVFVSTDLWYAVPTAALGGAILLAQPALLRRRLERLRKEDVQV